MLQLYKMENVENEQVITAITDSKLSKWSGAVLDPHDFPSEGIRVGEDRVEADALDFSKRLFNLSQEIFTSEFITVLPNTGTHVECYSLWRMFKASRLLHNLMDYYEGFAYDSVRFRFSLSNPKGVVGALAVGAAPYNDVFASPEVQYSAIWSASDMTIQHLLLVPDCELIHMSAAKDVEICLPWQCNAPYFTTDDVRNYNYASASDRPHSGVPFVYFAKLGTNVVSSIGTNVQLRIFVDFDNLRWLGPRALVQQANFEQQSGVEVAALVGLGSEIVQGAEMAGAAAVSASAAMNSLFDGDYEEGSSYESPKAVQLAYAGDTTSVGPPPTSPVFKGLQSTFGAPHSVLDILKEPQFLRIINTGSGTAVLGANPVASAHSYLTGNVQQCTYFRWFSKVASYWRGTINYHFVISGHPTVEVAYDFRIGYPPRSYVTDNKMSNNSTLNGVCSGVEHIVVPMPFLTQYDHLPIRDDTTTTNDEWLTSTASMLYANFTVCGTMLDLAPTIPVFCFISAGDDFEFLQPRPPGLVETDADLQQQIGLDEPQVKFDTRARIQNSTGTMLPLRNVEDFMKIWSRALPFNNYSANDEPAPKIEVAVDPAWFPMVGSTAAITSGVLNSWYVTNDFVSYLSSMFLYFRGSLGLKVLVDYTEETYAYMSLRSGFKRKLVNNPFTTSATNVPAGANFGYGTVITPTVHQPILEMTVPQRSLYAWGLVNPQVAEKWNSYEQLKISNGVLYSNVVLQLPEGDLRDSLFRKAGEDYEVAVRSWLPSPYLWIASGGPWS